MAADSSRERAWRAGHALVGEAKPSNKTNVTIISTIERFLYAFIKLARLTWSKLISLDFEEKASYT